MIIEVCGGLPLVVGQIVAVDFIGGAEGPQVNARIIRIATEEEYIEQVLTDPCLPEELRKHHYVSGRLDLRHYEVCED